MRTALVSLLLLAACKTQSPTSAALIVKGEDIAETELPAVVKVDLPGSLCTGTFIGPRKLLTAAHCVVERNQMRLLRLTQTGGVATAEMLMPHGYKVGQLVMISSYLQGWDGNHAVTSVPTPKTFTFAVDPSVAADAASGGGTPSVATPVVMKANRIRVNGKAAYGVAVHPQYPGLSEVFFDTSPVDAAVVTFDSDVAPATAALAAAALPAGTEVLMVGYGKTNASQMGAAGAGTFGKKRRAKVAFSAADQTLPGYLRFVGAGNPLTNDARAATAPGDSGGPLLSTDGKTVYGVLSGGDFQVPEDARVGCLLNPTGPNDCVTDSRYVDLTNADVRAFLDAN